MYAMTPPSNFPRVKPCSENDESKMASDCCVFGEKAPFSHFYDVSKFPNFIDWCGNFPEKNFHKSEPLNRKSRNF